MDTIIQELISYDRQAREILQGAVQAKEQAEKELPAEEEKLYHDFLQRAKERTDRIQEQRAGSHRGELAKLEEIYLQESQRLKKAFEENRQQWEQELFDRCVTAQ